MCISAEFAGISIQFVLHKFFSLANAFFRDLGFNVVISVYSDEETIRLAQQYARNATRRLKSGLQLWLCLYAVGGMVKAEVIPLLS
ncbi:hypothetical protein [Ruminococcus sp.]|uniref:hypothetical protein n=1 Tax=Ruminococcus sp. TaxID=41978 RepID=UPI003FD7F31E